MRFGFNFGFNKRVSSTANPTVSPVSSTLIDEKTITVVFPEAVVETCPAANQINITVNGGTPIHPASMTITGNTATMVLAVPLTSFDIVEWKYDNTGTCKLASVLTPTTFVGSRFTNSIINNIVTVITADSTKFTADSTKFTADKGN